jgi:hypothetical protein
VFAQNYVLTVNFCQTIPVVGIHDNDPRSEPMFMAQFITFPELVPEFLLKSVILLAESWKDWRIDVPL